MAKRECVEHLEEGHDAWQVGVAGFFSRWRGIALTAAVTAATMGVPWWWPAAIPATISMWTLVVLVPLFGVFLILLLVYNRMRSLRSLAVKRRLHEIAHFVRDQYTTACTLTESTAAPSDPQSQQVFRSFLLGLCNHTECYFEEILSDKRVATAIRLASVSDAGGVEYVTAARSTNLNPARQKTSEPIPANEGICAYLTETGNEKGVLIYNDLKEAAKMGAFKETANERQYPKEVVSMMVAPLNAWSDGRQRLIGLFYVSSRNREAFSLKDVDLMRFTADTIAHAISTVVNTQSGVTIPAARREEWTGSPVSSS